MPLLYFSPINFSKGFSKGAIRAISALIAPYGQGVTLNAVAYSPNTAASNLPRRILQAIVDNLNLLVESQDVSKSGVSTISLVAIDNTAIVSLTVCDGVTKTVPPSSLSFGQSGADLAKCVAVAYSTIADNVTEFSSTTCSLLVTQASVRAETPSSLLDLPSY